MARPRRVGADARGRRAVDRTHRDLGGAARPRSDRRPAAPRRRRRVAARPSRLRRTRSRRSGRSLRRGPDVHRRSRSRRGHSAGVRAEAVGRELGSRGVVLVCGGLGGAMEAACRGAKEAGGTTVGILPGARPRGRERVRRRRDPDRPRRGAQRAGRPGGRRADRDRRRLRDAVGDRAGAEGRQAGGRPRHAGTSRASSAAGSPEAAVEAVLRDLTPRLAGLLAGQSDTPYLDALRAYAARKPGRFHVPGHKGGAGADPGLLEALGERPFALDIPALTYGHRRRRRAHAVPRGAGAGRRGVGRAADLVPDQRRVAGQPRRAADARAPRATAS